MIMQTNTTCWQEQAPSVSFNLWKKNEHSSAITLGGKKVHLVFSKGYLQLIFYYALPIFGQDIPVLESFSYCSLSAGGREGVHKLPEHEQRDSNNYFSNRKKMKQPKIAARSSHKSELSLLPAAQGW